MSDLEIRKLVIRKTTSSGPHARLVLEPVVTRLEDLGLDGVLDDLEGLEGLLGRRVGVVELNYFVSGCVVVRYREPSRASRPPMDTYP